MKAVFVGTDGSMGLKNGQTYNVSIFSEGSYIWVKWNGGAKCPYSSIAAVAANWETPKKETNPAPSTEFEIFINKVAGKYDIFFIEDHGSFYFVAYKGSRFVRTEPFYYQISDEEIIDMIQRAINTLEGLG